MENDGFYEDDEERVVKSIVTRQQLDLKQRYEEIEEPEPYMDNIYDFHRYTADPDLKRMWKKLKEIDKNWVFGNYNPKDETFILQAVSLLDDVYYLLPKNSDTSAIKIAILRDIFARITVSRGRKGFAAKLFNTQIGLTKADVTTMGQKKSSLLSGLSLRKQKG